MATLEDFLPDVQPYCPGVPIPTAERAVLHALREFCTISAYWREDQTFTTVTGASGTGEYTVTLAAGSDMASLLIPITHKNNPVYLKNEVWLTENHAKDWRTRTGEQAKYFTMSAPTIVRLVPYPTIAVVGDLRITKILWPTLTSPLIDDIVLDYAEEISKGASARLMMMPGQQWTDERGLRAASLMLAFKEGCDDAKSKAIAKWQDRSHQRTRRTRGHFF